MSMNKSKKTACVQHKECVACGSCMKVCPLSAITIPKGIYAEVKKDMCVGCGRCQKVCPASVINIVEKKEVELYESKTKKVV